MIVNKKELKKNINFILVITISLVILFVISFFSFDKKASILEGELSESGTIEYHKLVINEYMSSNNSVISPDGSSYDWIELYNGTNKDINLKNYGLSDENDKIKWVFPSVVIEKNSYLIIYLAGKEQEGLYAPFKLKSSGGETITLTKPNGKVIDAIETVALNKGESVARNLKGQFIITKEPTPNYPNTKEGYQALEKALTIDNNTLQISEVLPRNTGNFTLNNKLYGYVEITNVSQEKVLLDNYYLSDDFNRLYKCKLPKITLNPNEAIVIYMGTNYDDNQHYYASFELEKKNGSVYLASQYGIIDKLTYEDLPNGFAYIKKDNDYLSSTVISPGYLNTNEGIEEFYRNYRLNHNTLLINEVMNNNRSYLAQNGYKFYDWIELYNNSDRDINLKDYTLATDIKGTKYHLPDVVLKPHTYYVVMASGDAQLSNKQYLHLDFKISETESIYLYNGKEIIDSVMISNIPLNKSYSRGESYGFYYTDPTPLAKNNKGVADISQDPIVSQKAGIYDDTISIAIQAPGTIYYTLDGSNPTTSSLVYKDKLVLDKTTVLKTMNVEQGKLKSDVITNSYIIKEGHTLPVLSMSLNESDYKALINNPYVEREVAGYLEFYEADGAFQIPCSISLFGGSARGLAKKSYGIRFKGSYGASELVYKLFDNRDTATYESLVLRSGSQDFEYAFFRDILGTSLMDDYTDVDTQSYKSAILYINGKYYGVYNIREKVNKDFISNHYNVDPDKLNLIQGNGELKNGTSTFYNNVLNFVRNHNMALDENYEKIKEMIDIDNFIDFWIGELYTTNNDIINIRYFSHPDIDNGKMKMIFFDLDWAFYNYGYNYYHFMTQSGGMQEGFNVDNSMFVNLIKNKNFKKAFLERLSYNLNNTWKEENVLKRFNEIYDNLYPEMQRDLTRWNLSFDNWQQEVAKLKNYITNRNKYLLEHTKTFFNLSRDEYNYYFGEVL